MERGLADLRILLVEDDEFTRKLIARLLQDLPVRKVWEACDGLEAMDILGRDVELDVMICDLEMPRVDGLQLLQSLRGNPEHPKSNLPAIVLTAHRGAEVVKRAIALGISGYLVKPVARNDLIKRLTFVLQRDG